MKAQDRGGWVVCERRKDLADGREKIFYLSSRYWRQEQASRERDRMLSTPEYHGRLLDVTYKDPKAPPGRLRYEKRR